MSKECEMNGLSIDEISGERIKTGLIEAVKKRLNSDNVELCIEHGSNKGDNFIGEIYRILYKDGNDSENEKQSSLILKIAPRNLQRRKKLRLRELFLREIDMYDQVLSYFTEFQLSKGVNLKKNGFNECPKCYFSISDELSESLFLEDLGRRKFEMINIRTDALTVDHVSLFMKALGKFHALSFAIKDQEPEKFKHLSSLAFEHYWTMMNSGFTEPFLGMIKRITDILEEEKRSDLIEKLKKSVGDDYMTALFRLISSELAEPYTVICHGDLTTNNTMISKNEHGKPIEIQFFDWQFTRCASPVIDIVLYLFCSTTKELRDQHYDDFLKIYHESLSDMLTRLGSDPEKLFPYEAFLDQMRQFAVYTVFVGSLLFPMLFAEVESMPDFDKILAQEDTDIDPMANVLRVSDETKSAYNKKVTDVFIDLARLGYI